MKKVYLVSAFLLILGISNPLLAQILETDWQNNELNRELADTEKNTQLKERYKNYRYAEVSIDNFKDKIRNGPQEISIPSPNGSYEVFEINPVQVVADEVKHLYTIKTFRGIKKGDPTTVMACDISDGGFHAAVFGSQDTYYIEPIEPANPEKVVIYFNKDRRVAKHTCQSTASKSDDIDEALPQLRTPTQKSTYKLAIAASGEYSQQFGGTPYSTTNVLNAIASGVNIINPIYLRDLGIEFNLVTTSALVYPDPNTDPFTDLFDGYALIEMSHTVCTNALGSSGFDVGHLVIWEDLGGLAYAEVVCDDEGKGTGYSGATGISTLWVDYVCHEIGHQFGSEHNFASEECGTSVNNFRYEPGEGSSIMSYADVCGGTAQYANASDPFFHYASINQIQTFVGTISCATTDASGNPNAPVPNAQSDITIPKQTPFILVGDATDGNDPTTSLTYHWEQYDGAGSSVTGSPDCNSTTSPLFRHRPPVSDNFRSFPRYNDVLAGNNNTIAWEKLPCTNRSMNVSLAVRDNNLSFGRVDHDQMVVTVANTGPFEVSAPNGGETLSGGENNTITWTVNGTNTHCPTVDILLSTDGGSSYSVIADAVNNDGSESVMIPSTASTTARIIVRCNVGGGYRAASTFYDISNSNFTIGEGSTATHQIENFSLSVYPNPVLDKIFIDLQETENFTFHLMDLNGRIIQEGEFNHSTNINTELLMSGLYYLQLKHENSGKSITEKIVVQK